MEMLALVGFAAVVCVLVLVLRQQKPEMGLLVTIGAGCVLTGAIAVKLAPVLSEIEKMVSETAAAGYLPVVLKAFGICLAAQLASDICRDAGQQTLAANVETAGRLGMLAASLPLLGEVLTAAVGIIEG